MNLEHTYANYVDEKGAAKIQALEKETGTRIMAYATPSVPAPKTHYWTSGILFAISYSKTASILLSSW